MWCNQYSMGLLIAKIILNEVEKEKNAKFIICETFNFSHFFLN